MNRRLASLLVLVAVLWFLAPAARAGEVSNENGKYDGLYKATVVNRTRDKVFEQVEVDLEGRFITARLPDGHLQMKISEMWNRHYQLEITAREQQSGDLYIIQVKT